MAKRRDLQPAGLADLDGDPGTPHAPDPVSSHDITLGSAPTPAEAEKAVERAEAVKADAAAAPALEEPPPQPVVPFRVFRAVSGIKPDLIAGFERHVLREEMRQATVLEWQQRYAAFLAKPITPLKRQR